MTTDGTRIALMCVQNAGRSQMATAVTERERARRDLEGQVSILTGGTNPAERVHDVVVEATAKIDIDISTREPQAITTDELAACECVATVGRSTLELDSDADVDVRDWALEGPRGKALDDVRETSSPRSRR